MPKLVKKVSRTQAREMESRIRPAIRTLSNHVHNTGETTDVFRGYKLPAGETIDSKGRHWQVQVHAYLSKTDRIKKNEVVPVIGSNAILFRLRVFLKRVIDTVTS